MDRIKKILVGSGYTLSAVGLFLSFVGVQVPSQTSYCMLTTFPFSLAGRLIVLLGLILMGLGFLSFPEKNGDKHP